MYFCILKIKNTQIVHAPGMHDFIFFLKRSKCKSKLNGSTQKGVGSAALNQMLRHLAPKNVLLLYYTGCPITS